MGTARSAAGRRIDLTGFALIVASAFCYSCLGILGKKALAEDVPLLSILSTRFTLGALIYWGWVLLRADLRRSVKGLAAPRARALFAWGLFGFAGQSVIFFAALQRISASLSEVLLYTCPAFLALILWVTTGRRPTGTQGGAIVLALSGTWLCAGPIAGATDSLGVALAVLAGFWYALFLLRLHRITPGLPSALSGALIISGAAVAFDLATLLLGGYHVPATPAAWGAILGMVLTATVFGFVLFVVGLKRVGAQTASILSTFEPLGTLMLARLLLGERLTPPQWAGAALIIGASFVLAATEPEGMESAAGAGAAAHD